jgi:hypothetical protein
MTAVFKMSSRRWPRSLPSRRPTSRGRWAGTVHRRNRRRHDLVVDGAGAITGDGVYFL